MRSPHSPPPGSSWHRSAKRVGASSNCPRATPGTEHPSRPHPSPGQHRGAWPPAIPLPGPAPGPSPMRLGTPLLRVVTSQPPGAVGAEPPPRELGRALQSLASGSPLNWGLTAWLERVLGSPEISVSSTTPTGSKQKLGKNGMLATLLQPQNRLPVPRQPNAPIPPQYRNSAAASSVELMTKSPAVCAPRSIPRVGVRA